MFLVQLNLLILNSCMLDVDSNDSIFNLLYLRDYVLLGTPLRDWFSSTGVNILQDTLGSDHNPVQFIRWFMSMPIE